MRTREVEMKCWSDIVMHKNTKFALLVTPPVPFFLIQITQFGLQRT